MLEGPGLPWDVHAQLQLHSGAGVQEQPVRVLLCTHVLQGRRGRHRCQLVRAPTLSWLHQGGAGRRLCVCVRVYVCVCVGGGGGWGVRGTALGIAVHVLVKIPTHAARHHKHRHGLDWCWPLNAATVSRSRCAGWVQATSLCTTQCQAEYGSPHYKCTCGAADTHFV